MSNPLGDMLLSKRGCVSNCVVPSCSSIKCASSEICILSSQTCDACPTVSCVSLAVTGTDLSSGGSAFPKGAIAGIVVAVVLLLVGAAVLARLIYRRRKVILEISEKAVYQEDGQDLEDRVVTFANGNNSTASRALSDAVSIQIALGSNLKQALETTSGMSSPLDTPDHFFSADELLRMSYAESARSRAASVATVGKSGSVDSEAAIMQANNPILAVRAKASVLQIQKASSSSVDTHIPAQHELSLQRQVTLNDPVLGSFFENDSESILNSPVELALISPQRFTKSTLSLSSNASDLARQDTGSRPRVGRSLTGNVSVPDQEKPSIAHAEERPRSQPSPATHRSIPILFGPGTPPVEQFEWQDPSKFDFRLTTIARKDSTKSS